MNEYANESFRAQVDRLVAEGKLTPEEAAGLLEGNAVDSPAPVPALQVAETGDTPPDLRLKVSGYSLTVIHDPAVPQPHLGANREGELSLTALPEGWQVARTHPLQGSHSLLKAILTVPFAPRHVAAQVEGGNLTLPDLTGELRADVNGGNIRMGSALSLQADVNGGNLNAATIHGPAHLTVNGGNLTLEQAGSLNASVNGGNLKWAGQLTQGDHRVEVNAGNATLHLLPGSSVQLDADVTVGAFKADFPTHRSGGFLNTRHSGQLGGGDAQLSCRVAAGQVKVVTA
ncbi:hypothetical protein DEIPH_ctg008orf0160 [Deinococcus phoenicis]|uniref:Adhesin domain-containing protein n=1 Tax=Deinococcus phoenicis TaxID=1476583 RepID=A0A016QTM9_9DEIO|nr:hypothetical protein [Deinococcus phoenicis]EYB69423.1 hypothetical protein DEIPH_ctg008orf0160 [Deinococcus phoenicis]